MRYSLFLLVIAVLFLRPAELAEDLADSQFYVIAILACLASSLLPLIRRLMPGSQARQPITPCLLLFAATVVLSHLAQLELGEAAAWALEISKMLILYLIVVVNLDTPGRLRSFLGWLGVFILLVALLAILQFHEVIVIPALAPVQQRELDPVTGEVLTVYPRMCGPGIFHDPNDLCLVLAVGIVIALYWLRERGLGARRFIWLAPLGVFAYGVALTLSRGGMLAVMAGLASVAGARFGTKKALAWTVVLLPLLIALAANRGGRLDLTDEEDSAQSRIHLWSEALILFHESPLTGIGAGQFVEQAGAVAHNSFLHAFVEVGFFGGCAFLGAFGLGLLTMRRVPARATRAGSGRDYPANYTEPLHDQSALRQRRESVSARGAVLRLQPFLFAILVSFTVGALSLSRPYSPMTYVVLGLTTAYLRLAEILWPGLTPRLTARTVLLVAGLGLLYLAGLRVFVAVFVRWSASS